MNPLFVIPQPANRLQLTEAAARDPGRFKCRSCHEWLNADQRCRSSRAPLCRRCHSQINQQTRANKRRRLGLPE